MQPLTTCIVRGLSDVCVWQVDSKALDNFWFPLAVNALAFIFFVFLPFWIGCIYTLAMHDAAKVLRPVSSSSKYCGCGKPLTIDDNGLAVCPLHGRPK